MGSIRIEILISYSLVKMWDLSPMTIPFVLRFHNNSNPILKGLGFNPVFFYSKIRGSKGLSNF